MEIEASEVARFIKRRIDAKTNPGQILILAPRRQFGYGIRDALRDLDVHAHSFFNEEALDGNPRKTGGYTAQEAFTLLGLLADPEDRVAMRCWIGFGNGTLRERGWREIRRHSAASGLSPRQVLTALAAGGLTLPYVADCVDRYMVLVHAESQLTPLTGRALLDAVFPLGPDWAEPFQAHFTDRDMEGLSARELMDELTVAITRPELPTDVDYVRVMSLHKSKGLTANLVVVVGCIEGLIPTLRDGTDEDRRLDLEEQRRLFYVALTRTSQTLVVSSVKRIRRDLAHRIRARVPWGVGTLAPTVTSRFVQELGPDRPTPTTALP